MNHAIEIAAVAVILVLAYSFDKKRAAVKRHRFIMGTFMEKALADKNHMVRIPAELVAQVFNLKVRTLPDPDSFNGKPACTHPAAVTPAKRKHL